MYLFVSWYQRRKSHLKKCASANGVSPEQLMAVVKRQREEHTAALDAGLLPADFRSVLSLCVCCQKSRGHQNRCNCYVANNDVIQQVLHLCSGEMDFS
jgi:hypothetical protein